VPSSGPQSSHINLALKSLHWFKTKILSLTYKIFTTSQPSYLYNLISVQSRRSIRSSDVVTLSRPPSSSSLKVNNRSFRHASPSLWNQFPKELRLPTYHTDLSLSSDLTHVSSSYHHCHHPLLLLSSIPGSKLTFSTNPFLHSFATLPPTGLTPRTPADFVFPLFGSRSLLATYTEREIPNHRSIFRWDKAAQTLGGVTFPLSVMY